ncbi:zinc finger protein 62 homolog [Helicoverpa zea]|uniref:zinc finger protein 62 homolog n=1 Tax=Helicoverpa zea TaxID=7113 RepID=UPI001F59E0CF|nr:zinc finger protein 62 homolog [Helicoverpa zea]
MRCCVPNCKNDSRHISKSQGITFHVFPNEASLRSAWLKALGKETWEPKERSAVCSEHFLCDDLYETKSGLRKVRSGAVPLILQDTMSCEYGEPATLKACRICLVMDVKLIPIRVCNLEQAYENLTGISLNEDKLPQKLCVECVQRLNNCSQFRLKSLRANSLMLEVIKKHDILTVQNIKTINRENNQLASTLSYKKFEVNHYDSYYEYTDPIWIEEKPSTCNIEVKVENEIFLPEEIAVKINDDGFNEVGINEAGINDNGITDGFSDNDASDKEFVIVSDKDYSSDDSLPLEKCKTKRTRKRKIKDEKPVKTVKKVKKVKEVNDSNEPKVDRRRKPFLNDDLNETLFTIRDLTIEEQIAEILKRRDSANYKNAIYKCTACFKGFLDEDAYNSHMTRHTDQCGEHECGVCKTHFKHPHALRKHITAHHTQRFSCKQCPYITTHRQTARLHERWHKGTKYKCPHCQDEFVKFTTYMGHIRIKHPSDFVCGLCGFSFVSAKGIELHKKLKHRLDNVPIPDDGPQCEPCNVRFVNTDAYKRHLTVSARHNADAGVEKRVRNKPRKGRKTKEMKEMERRARENSDSEDKRRYPSQIRRAEGPIPCEQCGLQLEDSRAYHGHFRRMHPDKNRTNYPSMKSPCMCEVCGRMFQSFALLKDHTYIHTDERPFKCEICSKSFRMKQRLVAHRRVHSEVRASYVCKLCGKQFSTHSNRQRHMFIHTGLKPFKCEMCGKGFKHASEKRAHITYVHLKKPWPKRARGKRRPDTRQGQMPPGQGEMDMAPPMWPCDPKMAEMGPMIEDKPVYYNLKI